MKVVAILLLAASSALAQCVCGGRSYAAADVRNAINKGYSINPTPATSSGHYPHRFNNRERLAFPPACAGKILVEYPLKQGAPYSGSGPPGPDRIVYLYGTKTSCGCMMHISSGAFALCYPG